MAVGELVEGAEHRVDTLDRGEGALESVDLVTDARIRHLRTLGRHDHGLGARARNGGEERVKLIERHLRLGARNAEGLVRLAAECDTATDGCGKQHEPRDDDQARTRV